MERRLAAILAADVVGYSRLMERDESGTLTALTAMREEILQPLVDRHHGRVVKLMGDGVLAEFSSAVNAVACAVDVQGAMAAADADVPGDQRIVLRIGINLGDVMVQGTDLYGDGVNVAARLEAMGEPGTVYISGSIHDQVEGKLDIDFQDIGLKSVKNMAAPVRVYRIVPAAKAAGESRRSKHDASPLPSKPSIAVLPFMNMSGDAEQQYFSDGITEDIITELSRFRQLFVIARNSSFQYRGQDVDVKRLGRELGVQYVVEGSVRRAGNRVRVTAQLIDAPTGHHVWAERYDRDLEDIFAVQDEVTRRIVTSIAPRLQSEETHVAGRKLPGDMRAYDHYLKAKLLVDTPADVGDLERAREHCSAAIGIDPAYARAHAYRALSYVIGASLLEPGDVDSNAQQALESAERAVALDDNDNVCHWALGETLFRARQYDRALAHLRKALELNSNDADGLAASGYIQVAIGDPQLGLRQLDMALERNPSNPAWYRWMRGVSLTMLGRYDEALADFTSFGRLNPSVMRWRAYALAKLGRMDEARAQMQALLAARPDLTVGRMTKFLSCYPGCQDLIESLRQAGLPE